VVWNALGEALPQAVGIAISPIPIVLVVLMLDTDRGRVNGPLFATGWLLGLVVVAGASFALSDAAGATDPEDATTGSVIQVLLGVLFAALALKQWRDRPAAGSEATPPAFFAAVESASPAKAFGVGAVLAVANLKSLPLAISGGVAIAQGGVTGATASAAVTLFGVLSSLGVIAPVLALLVLGDRARGGLGNLKAWLLANNSTILIVLFTVIAAKLLGSGLALTA
jgi:hypothetical protein